MARKAITSPVRTDGKATLQALIDAFINNRQLLGLSPTSIKFYQNAFHYIMKTGFPDNVSECTTEFIEDYIAGLLSEGMKPVTLNGKLRALKALFNFAEERKYLPDNPMRPIKFMKHEKHIIRTFEPAHIKELLNECLDGTFVGVREYALILLMLDTGGRASELLGLRTFDVNMDEKKAVVMGKGRKARHIFFSERTADALRRYLIERGQLDHDVLFVAEDNSPLKLRSLQDRLKDVGYRAGISEIRVSPHTFRHTFAKMYVQNGGDIFTLQKLLGHTTIEMVRNYVEMFGQDVANAHERFSPVKHI